MRSDRPPTTSPTLLGRLRRSPPDQAAWEMFVDRYSPHIYSWCRRKGLNKTDAEDATQEVLVRLAREMQTFAYDSGKCFRGWLKTVSHRAAFDFVRSRATRSLGNGRGTLDLLDTLPAREEFLAHLEGLFDRERLDVAMSRVKERVNGLTWSAFHLLKIEGYSGAETAAQLQVTPDKVYVYANRVVRMIRDEIGLLEDGPAEGSS